MTAFSFLDMVHSLYTVLITTNKEICFVGKVRPHPWGPHFERLSTTIGRVGAPCCLGAICNCTCYIPRTPSLVITRFEISCYISFLPPSLNAEDWESAYFHHTMVCVRRLIHENISGPIAFRDIVLYISFALSLNGEDPNLELDPIIFFNDSSPLRERAKLMYSTISRKAIGPDMFSWIRHCMVEVCALPIFSIE